ncbi:MAG: T9SS type A sorting domain-containing protein [Chitinophagaceae bacterium]|jgi:predicted lipoprotein with Yx(FWY)xxD motif|nr:T9SS type A sorting domain-containing protein [Chitinophagaceae bacterium]MBP6371150.1 T9SS type A sorting domain-containing protein [Ferruginibacter sp.]NMD29943.1 T9SS type A sorting domain-containing protein [Bacteroidota bacterium]MBK7087595.1 T9SS type A sorting domain-containing protein [Chitinophagaceae bacterium]MBK7346366.1 T9SS type A sorting domain-containing protein [Chitinophagaceae bacterium]
MRKLFILISLLNCYCALAQWSPNPSLNNAICNYTSHQMDVQMVSDGSGGAIVVWRDGRNIANAIDIYAQHISASGNLLWNVDAVPICNAASDQFAPRLVSDGANGAIIAWYDNRSGNYDIYAQRINSSGVVQWTTDGVAICIATGNQNAHQLLADGNGGAFIVWSDGRTSGPNADIYGQLVNAAGVVQWTANGAPINYASSLQNIPQLTSDGGAGFFVSWEDWRNFGQTDIYVQKVSSNGFYTWSYLGVGICVEANGAQYNSKIVADGAGGAIICWQDKRTSSSDDIYAQKINTNGVVQWTNNGVLICNASGLQINEQMLSDGAGGAIICWEDRRAGQDIYAQRINTSGAVQWAANGVAVCSDGSNQNEAQIITTSSGAAIVCWTDYRNAPGDIYAQKLNSSGAAQWAVNGVPVSNATNDQAAAAIINDGNDNAIIAWRDLRTTNDYDIYSSRLLSNGTLPVRLIDFSITEAADHVKLYWKTSDEINNAGFVIERSNDGINWVNIGYVAANPASSSITRYSWNDYEPLKGKSYYRLQQTDLDGSREYSKILFINRNLSNNSITVYPNPATDIININFGGRSFTGTVQLFNHAGQLMLESNVANQLTFGMNTTSFAKGKYNLVFSSASEKFSKPIIVQ